MKSDSNHTSACTTAAVDSQGRTNLCCCYVMTTSGGYEKPCFEPVETCCLNAQEEESGYRTP
jgi:hypothetical protein